MISDNCFTHWITSHFVSKRRTEEELSKIDCFDNHIRLKVRAHKVSWLVLSCIGEGGSFIKWKYSSGKYGIDVFCHKETIFLCEKCKRHTKHYLINIEKFLWNQFFLITGFIVKTFFIPWWNWSMFIIYIVCTSIIYEYLYTYDNYAQKKWTSIVNRKYESQNLKPKKIQGYVKSILKMTDVLP